MVFRALLMGLMALASSRRGEGFVDARAGDDAHGDGTAANPWKTIGRAVERLGAGDVCRLRSGVYRETVRPKDGQVFEPVPGETVLITGCDPVTSWTPGASPEHPASAPVAGVVREVFMDGRRMPKARYPDEDGDPYSTGEWADAEFEHVETGSRGLARVRFAGARDWPEGHWVGAWYTGLHGDNIYNANFGRVVKSKGNEILLTDLNRQAARRFPDCFGPGKGVLIHHRSALDAPGEWHAEEGTLRFRWPAGADPARSLLEAQVRLWGFDLSGRKGVVVRGLHFTAASVLMEGSEHCLLERCTFRHHAPWGNAYDAKAEDPYADGNPEDGTSGIHVTGTGNTVRDCVVAHAWGAGISPRGRSITVEGCRVEDVNWMARQNAAPISGTGRGLRILRNTIRTTSAMGIALVQMRDVLVKQPEIRLNDIRDTGRMVVDGGSSGIYVSNHAAPTDDRTLDGGVISHNLIADVQVARGPKGFGIYLDDGTDGAAIHHNAIHGRGRLRWGIFLHYNQHVDENLLVAHNTIWGCRDSAVACLGHPQKGGAKNVVIRNNLAEKGGFSVRRGEFVADHNRTDVPSSELADPDALDFRLRETSPARDAGAVLPEFQDTGSDRKPDLGAFEFGAPGGPWNPGSALAPPFFPAEELLRKLR